MECNLKGFLLYFIFFKVFSTGQILEVESLFFWFWFHHFPVPHVGSESVRDDDGAVLCLVLFTDGDQHPGHSTARPIDCVKVDTSRVPDVESPGLIVSAVTAGADLAPDCSA